MSAWLRIACALVGAALSVFVSSLPAFAQGRVALVIGNSTYQHGTSLSNPKNDASDVAIALRRIGFAVVEGRDLDKRAMEDKVREFSRKLDRANLALFFYAGHGMQVSGRNYLLPVDAKLERAGDLNFEAIDVSLVLEQMEAAKRVNLVFLDACRDNPLSRSFAPKLGTRSAAVGRGLASIQSAIGTLIAYATQPDNVALDGEGRNSPFTAALLKYIDIPGLEISSMMKRVRSDVIAATGEKQVPWDHSSLIGDVVLVPAPVAPAVAAPANVIAALAPPASPPVPAIQQPRPAAPSSEMVRRQTIDGVAKLQQAAATVKVASEISKLEFSPDSQILAVGLDNGTVELRSVETQRVIRTLKVRRQSSPDSLAFSVDGRMIATSGDDVVKLWEVETGKLLRTFKGHKGHIAHLGFLPDGVGLMSADNNGSIKLWDIEEEKFKGALGDRTYTGHLADFSPDGRMIAWSGVDRTVTLWDIEAKRAVQKLHGHKDLLVTVKFSPDSQFLASASADNAIKVWDVDGKRLVHTLNGHQDRPNSLAFSPGGHWLASGASDETLRIWDLGTGRLLKTLKHAVYVAAIAVSPDGKWLASADSESRFMLWPVAPEVGVAGK